MVFVGLSENCFFVLFGVMLERGLIMTLEQAKNLKYGDTLHHTIAKNADGTPQRWKVTGKPKIWKTRPAEVKIPVKRGRDQYGYVTENDLNSVELA